MIYDNVTAGFSSPLKFVHEMYEIQMKKTVKFMIVLKKFKQRTQKIETNNFMVKCNERKIGVQRQRETVVS